MADNQGSARVTLKEIDLSQVRDQEQLPVGVPAAVVGTAKRGPAFVPETFATIQQFNETFGSMLERGHDSNSNRFGPLAVSEWMRNAQSGAFVRVLGVGTSGTLSSLNKTDNAGFIVGEPVSYENDVIVDNKYATFESTTASKTEAKKVGRTHFLGCFMKDTSSSSFLKDAGLETEASGFSLATVNITDEVTAGGTITIEDASGNEITYTSANAADFANNVFIDGADGADASAKAALAAQSLADAIAHTNGHNGTITATVNGGQITLEQTVEGAVGNTRITENADNLVSSNFFSGGSGGAAVPVIRGILMTPQGVKPSLNTDSTTFTSLTNTTDTQIRKSVTSSDVLRNFGLVKSTNFIGYQLGLVNDNSFTLILNGFKNSEQPAVLTCSFDPESVNYFAKVLNTDPEMIEERGHFLYSHWDVDPSVCEISVTGLFNNQPHTHATLATASFCLSSQDSDPKNTPVNGHPVFEDFETRFRTAKSPWFTSQKFGGQSKKLFRLYSLDDGTSGNSRFRILISDLKLGKTSRDWSTFTLSLEDFDSDPINGEIIASWKNLSLDPNSRNFLPRVLGDKNIYYNFNKKKLVEEGDFDLRNKYVRVEVTDEVLSGDLDPKTLPSGFQGYLSLNTNISGLFDEAGSNGNGLARLLNENSLDGLEVLPMPFVKTLTRQSGSSLEASSDLAWGVKFAKKKNAGLHKELSEIRLNPSIKSWTKFYPDIGSTTFAKESTEEFSLEKIAVSDKDDIDWSTAEYARNSLPSGKDYIEISSAATGLNSKYLKFRCIMQGGFDGLDIFNKEKANLSSIAAYREANEEVSDVFTGPTVESFKKAIDVLSDKSATEIQLLAVPGMREPLVTDYAITACENRFDAMLVMDVEEIAVTQPITDGSKPHVQRTINRFDERQLDTSFAAAYFPDVISRRTSNNTPIQVPPSVCMLGVMSQNDTLADPWFAPAGLTRGRLNASSVKVQMNRDLLNNLYDVDINPIYEPSGRSGEVYAFGQKTLLQDQSSLDRINVRRLLINLRRKVKAVANTLLFEPNRASTLERFRSLVEPIMAEVQARQGVERYKVQIDTSTTTQNDIENNTIRGKVYLQPTKSVEFISIDFVVTNSID